MYPSFPIWEIEKKCWHGRANFFWADGTDLGSIGGLAAALSPETVLLPDEKHACARFSLIAGYPIFDLAFFGL